MSPLSGIPKRIGDIAYSYGLWVGRHRWPMLFLSLAATLAFASGVARVRPSNDYHDIFGRTNPDLIEFDALQAVYAQNNTILIAVAPEEGDVFDDDLVRVVESATERAWGIPNTVRVDSYTNYQHIAPAGDGLDVRNLGDYWDGTEAGEAMVRRVATRDALLAGRLVSRTGDMAAIVVTLQLPGDVVASATAARELAEAMGAEAPGARILVSGTSMMDATFAEVSQADMAALMPIMIAVMGLLMFITMRSIPATFATAVVVVLSAASGLALAGWTGILLTPPSATTPMIVMTLAVADSVHIIVTLFASMRGGLDKPTAIAESLRKNALPVFLTSASTAVGFLTMNLSDFQAFADMGNLVAFGVLAALILSLTLLPALLAVMPMRAPMARSADAATRAIAGFAVRNHRALLASGLAVTILAGFLLPRNEVDDRFLEYFSDGVPFKDDSKLVTRKLDGMYQVDFSVGAGGSGEVSDPAYLAKLEEFAVWYRTHPSVAHVAAFTDVMKTLNRAMEGGDDSQYRIPETRDLAAQYLLLYELSLPYGLDLTNQVDLDKGATRVTVTLKDVSAKEVMSAVTAGERWLEENAPEYMRSRGTGLIAVTSRMTMSNPQQMLLSGLIAIVAVSALLGLFLDSWKLAAISLIPNLAPLVLAFGAWALLSGVINTGVALVLGMTIGIIVDDTIHLLMRYRSARTESGATPEDAARQAIESVGLAVITTTVILFLGFSVLMFSSFTMNSSMAKVTALAMAVALAMDLLVLPGLLIRADKDRFLGRTSTAT